MTPHAIGEQTHALLHDFEVAHQRFVRLGIEDHQAKRMALFAALRLTGAFSTDEAWKTVDEIIGPYAMPAPVER